MLAVGEHRIPEVGHSLTGRGDGRNDRRAPSIVGKIGQIEHLHEIATRLLDALAVGLVDDEDVGDLHQAGLVGLHAVAPARIDDDDGRVGFPGHLDLDLTDPDRFDDDPMAADRVEQADGFGGRE